MKTKTEQNNITQTTILMRCNNLAFLPSRRLFALITVIDKSIQLRRSAKMVFGKTFVVDWDRYILFSGQEMVLDRKDNEV